jgi:hypothetical protein
MPRDLLPQPELPTVPGAAACSSGLPCPIERHARTSQLPKHKLGNRPEVGHLPGAAVAVAGSADDAERGAGAGAPPGQGHQLPPLHEAREAHRAVGEATDVVEHLWTLQSCSQFGCPDSDNAGTSRRLKHV